MSPAIQYSSICVWAMCNRFLVFVPMFEFFQVSFLVEWGEEFWVNCRMELCLTNGVKTKMYGLPLLWVTWYKKEGTLPFNNPVAVKENLIFIPCIHHKSLRNIVENLGRKFWTLSSRSYVNLLHVEFRFIFNIILLFCFR